MSSTHRLAKLALSDGTVFTGRGFGAEGEIFGEVVFNTSMTGYQEILTDPSYCGQIVTMTYPHIGNYGSNREDVESGGLSLSGFIVRELCRFPSNYRSNWSLDEYLARHNVIGLEGIDTRALVRRLRVQGVMTGVLSTTDLNDHSLIDKARRSPNIVGLDLVKSVMPKDSLAWTEGVNSFVRARITPGYDALHKPVADNSAGPHVVAIDYGMKWNIPRHLRQMGCRVTVVPGSATADEVLAHHPDGVFLSNGPGDPRPLDYAINTIRGLLGKKPIFGICLGHQLLGLALRGEIFKLKFGHRGANQPVLHRDTGRVEITSQNHGFALQADSLPKNVEVTHINLNDQTVEGIRCVDVPAFGVQYHPEASAGPHDSHYLFNEFRKLLA
jgi:carbamoyl-phosphate synthase small subunit